MEKVKDERTITSTIKPRNSFIAFLLSLLFPGLGQVYNGQLKKALFFFGLLLLFPLLFGLTGATTFFYGLLSVFAIEIVLRIYIIIDGVKNAKRKKDYVLKPYNTWYYHLLIAAGMLIVFSIYDVNNSLGIKTFKIPSSSNNPTIQVGDWLVADMKAYRNSEPDYGDIVVYTGPDEEFYVFRVVGLPNDDIELVDNIVRVNSELSKVRFIKAANNDGNQVLEFEEELPNGHKHLIYKLKQPHDNAKINIKNIIVPSGSYYLLGDNRDNAADSRYEGFISKDRIKGQIIFSYWGQNTDRINIDFKNN